MENRYQNCFSQWHVRRTYLYGIANSREKPSLVTLVEYLLSDLYDPLMGIQFLDAWIYMCSMIMVLG